MKKIKIKPTIIAVVLLVVLSVILYYSFITVPFVKSYVEENCRARAVNVINASAPMIERKMGYDRLFNIVTDEKGRISYVMSNSTLITALNSLASTEMQNRLDAMQKYTLSVPVGTFTGLAVMSTFGGDIDLNVVCVGTCDTRVRSEFVNRGLNQLLHRLLIDVYITVDAMAPWKCETVKVWYEIVLAENIYSGDVPSTFIGSNADMNYLDLLP